MTRARLSRASGERGHSVVEVGLMAPWIFFLFIAIFDFGFHTYALISVQNAARAAALFTSSSVRSAADSITACYYVRRELADLANVRTLTSCSAAPLIVTAEAVNSADSPPPPASPLAASRVTVQYQTASLIPLPFIPAQLTITRAVEMRVRTD